MPSAGLISGSVQENQQRAAASAPHDLRPYGGLDCRLRKTGTLEAFSPEPYSGCNRVAEKSNGKDNGDKKSDGGQQVGDLNEKGQTFSPQAEKQSGGLAPQRLVQRHTKYASRLVVADTRANQHDKVP